MTDKTKKVCPTCQGNKIIPGVCECDTEWRGTQKADEWEECQCTPDKECSMCDGKGFIEEEG